MRRSIVTAEILQNRLVFFDNSLNQILEKTYVDASMFEEISRMLSTNVSARYAFAIFRIILIERNTNKILNLLKLLEFLIMSGSNDLRRYYGDADFLDELHNLMQNMSSNVVQAIVNFVFVSKHGLVNFGSEMKSLEDFYRILRVEGHKFPDVIQGDIFIVPMEDVKAEAKWLDGDYCENCRAKFTTFNRKHHCRNCGNIFCEKCSSKKSVISNMNSNQSDRVCDLCYQKFNVSALSGIVQTDYSNSRYTDSTPTSLLTTIPVMQIDIENTSLMQEEDDFAKAIELSLKEYNEKEAAKIATKNQFVQNIPIKAEEFNSKKIEPPKYDYPTIAPPEPVYNDDSYADEAFVKSCEEIAYMIEKRLKESREKGLVLYKDVNLQAYVQALIAKQGQLQGLIQSNNGEQSEVANILSKIELVVDSRKSLDEVRNKYKLNMRRQQEDAEMLLRLQTEQKMEFLRNQRRENEYEAKKLEEEHRRKIQNQIMVAPKRPESREFTENYTSEQSKNVKYDQQGQFKQDYQKNDFSKHSTGNEATTTFPMSDMYRRVEEPYFVPRNNPHTDMNYPAINASNIPVGYRVDNTAYPSLTPEGYPSQHIPQYPASHGEHFNMNQPGLGNFAGYSNEHYMQTSGQSKPQAPYYAMNNPRSDMDQSANQRNVPNFGTQYVDPQNLTYQQYQTYPQAELSSQQHNVPYNNFGEQYANKSSAQANSDPTKKKSGSDRTLIDFE